MVDRILHSLMFAVLLAISAGCDSKPPFSQKEYDEGFLMGFTTNVESRGQSQACFLEEAWSMGRGFDDGRRAFEEIYDTSNYDALNFRNSTNGTSLKHINRIIDRVNGDETVFTEKQKNDVLAGLQAMQDELVAEMEEAGGPIKRALSREPYVADVLSVGDPIEEARELVEAHLGIEQGLAITHQVDGLAVIQEPAVSHSLPIENCILIAYQRNEKVDSILIARKKPDSEQAGLKDEFDIQSVDSYEFVGRRIQVSIEEGDSLETVRTVVEQNKLLSRKIDEYRYQVSDKTLSFKERDSAIYDIRIDGEVFDSVSFPFVVNSKTEIAK